MGDRLAARPDIDPDHERQRGEDTNQDGHPFRHDAQAFLSIFMPHEAATTIAAMPIMRGTARSTIA